MVAGVGTVGVRLGNGLRDTMVCVLLHLCIYYRNAPIYYQIGLKFRQEIKMNKKQPKKNAPEYHQQGNFTVCIIKVGRGHKIGVAKLNPNLDEPNVERAKQIALARALKGTSVRLK